MKATTLHLVAQALNDAGVTYLIVGGLAVIAHGYLRFTKDIDLVVRLSPEQIVATFQALAPLGYQPIVPITAEQLSDADQRAQWHQEKGMVVLSFWSDLHPETPLDLFIQEPFDFAAEEAHALHSSDPEAPALRFVSLRTLIAMKQAVGRPLDLADIEKLRIIADLRSRAS